MTIVIDEREKLPFTFQAYEDVQTKQARLQTGDYSVLGLEHKICVERKSIGDLALSLGRDRQRFLNEMSRGRGLPAFVVVCESPFEDLEAGRYKSMLSAQSAVSSVVALMCRWSIPFFFASDRDAAERFTYRYLKLYAEGQLKELKALQRAMQGTTYNGTQTF